MLDRDQARRRIVHSANVAFRAALPVLLVSVLTLPVRPLIKWLFNETERTNWKLQLTVGAVLSSIVFVAIFISSLLDLRKLDLIDSTDAPAFPAQSLVSGIYGVASVLFVGMLIGVAREGDSLWMMAIPLALVGVAFYGWPRTIHCYAKDICQRKLWGREKRIPYSAVEAITVGHNECTTVQSDEVFIVHTQYHVDPQMFRDAVSARNGKAVF